MSTGLTTIYRYSIWQTEEGFKFDKEIQSSDLEPFMIETFHKPDEVYTIMSESSDEGDDVPVFMVFADNIEKLISFVQGIKAGLKLEDYFNLPIPEPEEVGDE